jgi:hypothetical protein
MCLVIPALAAAAPTLFGTAAATMATTSAAVGLVGAGMSAYGMHQQSAMEKGIAKQNAATAEQQAADARLRGEDAAAKVHRDAEGLRSAQRAAYAGAGLDVNFGTPLSLQEQTSFFGEWDANTVRTNAGKEGWALDSESANLRARAKSIHPDMNAASTLLTQGSQVASNWYMMKKA